MECVLIYEECLLCRECEKCTFVNDVRQKREK